MERAVWYPKNHFTQKHYFTVRLTKLLTNCLQSSLQTWQFHYVFVNQIVNSETKLWISRWISRWISLGSCEARAIRCSWFDNITTQMNLNKVKKKILNQATLILWCLVLKMYTKLFEKYRRTPHHRRMARLAFCLQ